MGRIEESELLNKKYIKNKRAFTLAEVLITLGIIGVVAALTIPTLIANYQTKSWTTASEVFKTKFTEAIKVMNVQGRLGKYGKYNTTEDFVEEVQKHFKTSKVCDNSSLMQCFEKTIIINDKKVDMSRITKASHFGQEEWKTNIVGVQFANGVTGLIAYNPECKSNPHDNNINGQDCFALVYDTSGFSEPNEMNKDVNQFGEVNAIANNDCALVIGKTCYATQPFFPIAITKAECEANKDKWGIKECHYDNDFWAGLVKRCGHVDKVPSMMDLAEIANVILETDTIGEKTDKTGFNLKRSNVTNLGFTLNASSYLYLWSNIETDKAATHIRQIMLNGTAWNNYILRSNDGIYGICKK